MRSIREFRKLENRQLLFACCFGVVYLINSVTIIHAGVVRREIVDRPNDSGDGGGGVSYDDVGATSTTTTIPELMISRNATLQSLTDATTDASSNKNEVSSTVAAFVVTTNPPLTIARVTASDIRLPQATFARSSRKLTGGGDKITSLKVVSTAEIRLESTTIPSAESQLLQNTTAHRSPTPSADIVIQPRKGKTIISAVVVENGGAAPSETVITTKAPKQISVGTRESSSDNIRPSDQSGSVNNSETNITNQVPIGAEGVKRPKVEKEEVEEHITEESLTELPHTDYSSHHRDSIPTEQSDADESTFSTYDYGSEDLLLTQTTLGYESDLSSPENEDDKGTTEIRESFDTSTVNFVKSETDENPMATTIRTLVDSQSNKSMGIINSETERTNYDVSVNEIRNSTVVGSGVKRGKFIKGEANMTIPDAAEVWALASMKNVKNIKDKSGNLMASVNTTSEKIKPNRNETTSSKLLLDWSQIMKEVEVGGDNLTNNANSVENSLENGIKNEQKNSKIVEQKLHDENKETDVTMVTVNAPPPPPIKSTKQNVTLQVESIQQSSSPGIGQNEDKSEVKTAVETTIDKNQVDDTEQQHQQHRNLNENLKNSKETEKEQSQSAIRTVTESGEQVIKMLGTTTLPFIEGEMNFMNESSPNKVNISRTGAHKGTMMRNKTSSGSLSSTTEAVGLQTESIFSSSSFASTSTSPSPFSLGFDETTINSSSESVLKFQPTELFSSLSPEVIENVTEHNFITTTNRVIRTISPEVSHTGKLITTVPTFPAKIVSKETTKQPTSSGQRESDLHPTSDNTFATGPENSIESNIIDRIPGNTTPSSDQSVQDIKVAPTTANTTTLKINALPVDTNSVEHFGSHSTSTHKTVPTKAEEEYSIHNIPKFLEPTTELPFHSTTHNPPHLGGSMPNDVSMPEETDYNVIIAISVSVVGIIALILLVGFLYVMRKRQKQLTYGQRCRPVSLDAYSLDNVSVYNSVRRKGALRASKRSYGNVAFDDPSLKHNSLNVQELMKFVEKKSAIHEEFKDVPQITARPDEVPSGCEDKNRYANVIPLPETRVILQRQNDDEKTEYINANYVRGPKDSPNYYIACQAPLEATVTDFWRMIWEQNSRVIIMATDLVENGIEKCAEYLPTSIALDNHLIYGDFQITLKSREVKEKYAVSVLHLKNTTSNHWREITHFWYQWPETGVPNDEAGVIAMLLEARSCLKMASIDQTDDDKNETKKNGTGDLSTMEANGNSEKVLKSSQKIQGPLTVHCSPGTGRTGTIIACDIVLRSLEMPKRSVDIPQIVYYVRRGRASSVQTKEQYEFIYKVGNMYASKISGPVNDN